ncbi:MAG: N-6 DNA methylase, partial [Synergistaceae bacterium]|nr:N-6 DNA methylase [Synergistaceae bacterium]
MIDEQNFAALLLKLGFERDGCIYKKIFSEGVVMSADFFGRKLFYPVQIKGRERNDGFEQNENFVVFECVNRLLTKGYRPEDIELERQWQLGREAKGGRADICVSSDGSVLFIIECKTWGREFNNAMTDTKDDGAQLFSYWQQEQSCKWLVLYSSDFQDGEVTYKAPTINCSDDNNLLLLAEKDTTIKLFKNSHTVPEKVEAWKETYESKILDDLIFSDEATAYNIEVKPLRKKNLVGFDEFNRDRIINQFEEILRHNNVSDKENAFNRLIALFICKLVDETLNDEDSEVKFQYKQGVDTYESLQDRLQRLHRDGMLNFMNEEIFYVEPDYPKRLFAKYVGANRKRAIADLQRTIRNLKFYSNNDFAFKDVHNEELFLQNGKVLVEMVQLFEKFRIVYNSRQQLLGDLFEKLLNKGFKQNEGQFFTPIPITRFIWDCLPVARMVESDYPKIVDYACGAGHFLTEAIEAVNYFAKTPDGDNSWARDHIYGIEKDYRLARVAKISLFMNGAGEGNIIFGDGLEDNPAKGIEDGSFDVLVANPPYSVKDFIQHLQPSVKDRFALSKKIGHNGSEIETLFVERIAQLLKSRGIAAVILPSSILSNDSASYTAAREEFLQNFYIRAIVSFGAKTFSATGTNTVVMFLEKFEQPPREVDLLGDFVDAIFSDEDLTPWQDGEKIFEAYTAQIGVDQEFYRSFVRRELSLDELGASEYFKMYVNAFATKKTNKADDERKFYAYAREIEWEKILYFALVYKQKTVIINSPADNQGQKDFLGYEWSNRRGNEGMQVIEPGGKLYNDSDRAAKGTLAAAVRETFGGSAPALNDAQRVYASVVNTRDMLDFSRVSFNKALQLQVDAVIKNTSKYKSLKLNECVEVMGGLWTGEKAPLKKVKVIRNTNFTMQGRLNLTDVAEIEVEQKAFANRQLQVGDIILEKSGGSQTQAVGRVVYFDVDGEYSFSNFTARLRVKNDDIVAKYLYLVLNEYYQEGRTFAYQSGSSGLKNLDMKKYLDVPIPFPPLTVQQQIVAECEAVDDEYNSTRMSIESYRKKIKEPCSGLESKFSLRVLEDLLVPVIGSMTKVPQDA